MNKKLRELIARFPHVNPMARQCTDAELEAYMVQGIAAQNAEVEQLKAQRGELVKALEEAANSLRTISEKTGRDEYLENASDVRGYANSRYKVADEALSRIEVKI